MKYRDALMASIHKQLETWFDQPHPIPREEVYRFLHSLKGTSGTIGLDDLSTLSEQLLEKLEHIPFKEWPLEDLREFLLDLLTVSHNYRDSAELHDVSTNPESNDRYENQPLLLILDDDVTLLMYLKEQLEELGWSVIATVYPHKALDYFHDMQPDCLILDLNIPETGGFQIMQTLSEKIKKQYVPTTIISNDCSKDTRLRAYRLGADDFMCKPLDIDEMAVRLERQLHRKRWMNRILFVDELTGALNRNSLADTFERVLHECGRNDSPFSLAFLDIDYFKRVNDTYGHLIGDEVLRGFASFLQSRFQQNEVLFRYGGEEFILLLPRRTWQEAKQELEEALEAYCSLSFSSPLGSFSLSFSAGVVQMQDRSQSLSHWLELADTALYEAKKRGRRRIEAALQLQQVATKVKLRAAIIDDDSMIRTMLTESVTKCFDGWIQADIRVFQDGESFFADDWHRGSEPYLVILDGVMPGMDGLEVLQKIQELPNADHYMVIMLTGRKEEQDIVRALQLGADDYMTKPFSLKELEARIRRLVKKMK
ncbi:response regulator [Brevibacillus ruminantium]|uniref:Response regulator n=1 Tax=Brevibacillus ruminantium TaxID=2950604 RepID=A0ABY4WMW4_9BACL|nr:response regulator [Brevibacillus ruminantium]USG68505.1 response regulator [Brevibacillus ruminantium]